MKIKIALFSILREKIGSPEIELELIDGSKASDIIDELVVKYPTIADLKHLLKVSINHEYATPQDVVPPNAEVAVFPPVSGG